MNDNLRVAFGRMRATQAALNDRALTCFDEAVGNVVLRAAGMAMDDVQARRRGIAFRVVSCPTGSGKTMSAVAMIAAGYKADRRFSAAYIVDTVRQAEEVRSDIAKLIGPENVTCWTKEGHDWQADPDTVEEEFGFRPVRQHKVIELATSRVIVCTHAKWKNEIVEGKDMGIRQYARRPRSVIFVDEHPSLINVIERTPADIVKLRDRIFAENATHDWLPALNGSIERMDAAFQSKGATYAGVDVFPTGDQYRWRSATAYDLLPYTNKALSEAARRVESEELSLTTRFLTAAARGCAFLCRMPASFVAYELEFQPGPGHVLLDATADLTGMVSLLKGTEEVEVPSVDYRNLSITHIEQPKEFSYIPAVVEKAKTARPYAEWIKTTVMENTKAGDDVLVVAHKALFDWELLPRVTVDWEGREVDTLHWGQGIGSNRYKNKTHVFLFSEFFIPRRVTVSNVHGWTGSVPTDEALADANTAFPQGDYLTAADGHLLRWTKQLASRGNVRNVSPDGVCGPMKLYTTMSQARLFKYLDRLFPGAPAPVLVRTAKDDGGKAKKGAAALAELLAMTDSSILLSDEVERLTGVPSRNLGKVLKVPAAKNAADLYGWHLEAARGRGNLSRLVRR
jgi:hypothetical protein